MPDRRSPDEVARLGKEIYERDIRAQVIDSHHGEYIAIDVDSARWVLAGSEYDAVERLLSEGSDPENTWLLRVGYRATASFGAQPLEENWQPPPLIPVESDLASLGAIPIEEAG